MPFSYLAFSAEALYEMQQGVSSALPAVAAAAPRTNSVISSSSSSKNRRQRQRQFLEVPPAHSGLFEALGIPSAAAAGRSLHRQYAEEGTLVPAVHAAHALGKMCCQARSCRALIVRQQQQQLAAQQQQQQQLLPAQLLLQALQVLLEVQLLHPNDMLVRVSLESMEEVLRTLGNASETGACGTRTMMGGSVTQSILLMTTHCT